MRPLLRALAVLASSALAACAPKIAPPGPELGQPVIEAREIAAVASYKTLDGYQTTLRQWLPADPPEAVILALHGFNDHSTFIAPAAELWQQRGIATFAYDQRGFGEGPNRGLWAGAEVMAEDSRALLRLLRQRYPETPLYLLGESMGGAVAIAALTGRGAPKVEGLILAAPAVRSRETLNWGFRASLYLISHSLPWLALKPSGAPVQASDNIEALRALGADPLVIKRTRMDSVHGLVDLMDLAQERALVLDEPLLLLVGEKDELVPGEAMELFWSRLPDDAEGQRRATYTEGWHLLFKDLQAETVIEDVATWVKAPDQPLPSGSDLNLVSEPPDGES